MRVVRGLPPDFPAPICIVLHLQPDSRSLLAQILNREGTLAAKEAEDGERARNGRIYVAPPDHHLTVEKDHTLRVTHGPRENLHRPGIDALFRSAAHAYGSRAVGVILTGSLDDGTEGLLAIKRMGGIAIVQDPGEAMYASMPQSAIEHVDVDYMLPVDKIARQMTLSVRSG